MKADWRRDLIKLKATFRIDKSRWTLSPAEGAFLAILLLLLLFISWMRSGSGFMLWQDRGVTASTTSDRFVVEVEGDLSHPGIYTFPQPVGIGQILQKAGVRRRHIPQENVSKSLKTGSTILISQTSQGLSIQVRPMDSAKRILYGIPMDLNRVHADDLELIPGIGPALARRIVLYRERMGGFARVEELRNVSGIGRKKLESLRDFLFVDTDSAPIP